VKKKTGGDGENVIRFPEDESAFEALHAALLDEMKPVGERETVLVKRIARSWADLQRARQRETLTIEAHMDELRRQSPEPISNERLLAMVFLNNIDELEALQKKEMAIEDLWYRSRHALEREQKRRRKDEKAAAPPAAAKPKPLQKPRSSGGIHIVRKQEPPSP
jgi:cell division protein ZapA (FtsZ GTPase activity inhibitor)